MQPDPADVFWRVLAEMRTVHPRPEVLAQETTPPRGIAPYAATVTADVGRGEHELATGRFVLLYDPAGQEAWEGRFRAVTYLRADLAAEEATDPLFGRVAWSWLTESLATARADSVAPAGTVTRTSTESFGSLSSNDFSPQAEIRASWTLADEDGAKHLRGWYDLLCTAAGLPPAGPEVTPLRL